MGNCNCGGSSKTNDVLLEKLTTNEIKGKNYN